MLYRIPLTWGQNKLPWKLLHAALMFIALVLSIVGLCAVFDFHNAKNIANLYSLHSWIGIAATALFAIQVNEFKRKSLCLSSAIGWASFFVFSFWDIILFDQLVGCGSGWLPPALLPRITAETPETSPCLDGSYHTVAQHRCLHLRNQWETLLCSVSAIFLFLFMNTFISDKMYKFSVIFFTVKEQPMVLNHTLTFHLRLCWEIH